jgi:hypothetical protein
VKTLPLTAASILIPEFGVRQGISHDNEAARNLYESVAFETVKGSVCTVGNPRTNYMGLRLDFPCNRGYSTTACSLRR